MPQRPHKPARVREPRGHRGESRRVNGRYSLRDFSDIFSPTRPCENLMMTKGTIDEAHAAWDAMNQQVRTHERLLAEALDLYRRGLGPLPMGMIEEVRAMRADCNAKFQTLLAALGPQQ